MVSQVTLFLNLNLFRPTSAFTGGALCAPYGATPCWNNYSFSLEQGNKVKYRVPADNGQ